MVRCAVKTKKRVSRSRSDCTRDQRLSSFLFAVIMYKITDEGANHRGRCCLHADDIVFRRDQGRSEAETGMLEVCVGKKRDESKYVKDQISVRKTRK